MAICETGKWAGGVRDPVCGIAFVPMTNIRVSVTSVGRLYRFGVCSASRNNDRFCHYKSLNPGKSGVANVGVSGTITILSKNNRRTRQL